MDPFSAGANLIVGLWRTHKANEWLKLMFAMAWSYGAAFSFAAGTALIAHTPGPESIGTGLVAAASAVAFLFVRSPLTKGLLAAMPRDLVIAAEGGANVGVEHK